jgi:hypothetical protein
VFDESDNYVGEYSCYLAITICGGWSGSVRDNNLAERERT